MAKRTEEQGRTILVVDDDKDVRVFFERVVGSFETKLRLLLAEDLASARTLLDGNEVVLAFIDKVLPDGDGVEFCRELVGRSDFAAYVITGSGSTADCLAALEFGVAEYIPKPLHVSVIRDKIRRHVMVNEADRPVGEAMGRRAVSIEPTFHLVGESAAMIEVAVAVQRIAKTDATALVVGESGTGKEIVAKQIHQLSPRKEKKFVGVNCGAIPRELIESELFGHEKGAFTDAKSQRVGLFEEAQGGTIFLDEISSTSLDFQVKLLRVLQEGRMRRLGSNREIALDVRVIAASNKRMGDEIRAGNFREDLYFRLKGAEIFLPRLSERQKDILPLARHFGDCAARKLNKIIHFSDAVVSALAKYSWPGNVRELESVIDYAVPRCNGTVLLSDLPESLREAIGERARPTSPLVSRVEDVKPFYQLNHEYALAVLQLCEGNKSQAADLLDCNRKWLIKVEKREAAGEYCDKRSYALFGKARNGGADDGFCPQCGSKQPFAGMDSEAEEPVEMLSS